MNYLTLLRLQGIAAKIIEDGNMQTAKEFLDVYADIILETTTTSLDDAADLYCVINDYYDYVKGMKDKMGKDFQYYLRFEEFLFIKESDDFEIYEVVEVE